MASVKKVIITELQQDAAHDHGPPLVSLPSTSYIDRVLGMLTKHNAFLDRLIVFMAVLAILVMVVKK
jgi:hypothetical protein